MVEGEVTMRAARKLFKILNKTSPDETKRGFRTWARTHFNSRVNAIGKLKSILLVRR